MNIKRTDINPAQLRLYENSKRENVKNNADKGKNSSAKTESLDKITISSEAKSLNIIDFATAKAKADLTKDLSDMNLDKVNALKEEIRSGNYKIGAADIVFALISGGNV